MGRLEEIKEEYAKTMGFESWGDLIVYFEIKHKKLVDNIRDNVTAIYAKECVKASLERASENARVMTKNTDTGNELEVLSWTDSRNVKFSVSKQSILNEDNIVIL